MYQRRLGAREDRPRRLPEEPCGDHLELGLGVAFTVSTLTEGELDDNDWSFTDLPSDPMNGMTLSGDGLDDSRGVVFEWNGGAPFFAIRRHPAAAR
jgi:hypothetical protein